MVQFALYYSRWLLCRVKLTIGQCHVSIAAGRGSGRGEVTAEEIILTDGSLAAPWYRPKPGREGATRPVDWSQPSHRLEWAGTAGRWSRSSSRTVLRRAVKRSIGFTNGFHNHEEDISRHEIGAQTQKSYGAFSVIVKTDCETDGSFYSSSQKACSMQSPAEMQE